MFLRRLEIADLILIEPIGFALLVIDFIGPAMASDSRDAECVPIQTIGHEELAGVRQVGLAMIEHQPLLPEVREAMGSAVAVVNLLGPFVGNRDFLEDGFAADPEGLLMVGLQLGC